MQTSIKIHKTTDSQLEKVDFNNIPFGKIFSDHMFIADYENGEWKDLRIEPFGLIPLHPSAMALHYGQAIFEGMKASKNIHGQPMLFRPEQHSIRLNRSAKRLCMPDVPEEIFLKGVHALVSIDAGWIPPAKGSALYIRPYLFATDGFLGVRPSEKYKFMIITCPVGPYYNRPVSLWVETKYVRAVKGGVGESKAAGNYAAALLPTQEANKRGYDQVMWMDGHHFEYVEEVGTMNIFFVIDGVVITPATEGSILKGITRDTILQFLKQKGIPVEERKISITEVIDAHEKGTLQEIFGSGTAAVVSMVNKIAYKDLVIELPDVAQWKMAPMIKETIDGWRAGTIEDINRWVVPVNAEF